MKPTHAVIVAVVLAAALSGCAREAEQPRSGEGTGPRPNVVTVTVSDYSFQAPDSVPAGLTMIQALMRGEVPHHVNIVKLDSNRTAADYVNALSPGSPPPAWATAVGGPNPTENGTTANAMLVLEPGNYALICFVDVPEGMPHFMRGMFKDMKVFARADTTATDTTAVPAPATAAAADTPVELPAADVTMRLVDYDFPMDEVEAGLVTFRVENDSPQDHEVLIVQLHGATTVEQVLLWMENPQGAQPFTMLGGVAPIAPGQVNNFSVNLRRGRYGLICFVPDRGDGRPHFLHGMMKEMEVS
ncbi:MAG TPA: hypothetical protein VMM17_03635 [Gemmatimonadaceae bacterium]|nr:hypothetical protein [Gemmatimonadaceae bacterium]